MLKNLFLVFLIFYILPAFGQTPAQVKKVDHLFRNRTELHFRFLMKKKSDQSELTRRISIDHVRGDTVWAFANRRGMLGFFELGYSKFKILETPAEEYRRMNRKKKKAGKTVSAFDVYPTYPQYEQIMQVFATSNPAICQLVNLGTLPSGRKILALKISDSVSKREPEPQFFYTSSMHGDETTGYPLMLKLADLLLSGYGQNQRITQMVNGMEIWINPLANPDGTYRTGNNSVAGATRFNSANVDLNRNYPDPQDGAHPDGNPYQPETKIFMAFADTMNFVMSANFHGGAEVANFPWDTWQRRHADEAWWTTESDRFADSARVQAPANFFNQLFGYPNLPGVVQGFDWYEVNGGRQDYMNWFKNCRELTVELSNTKLIPDAQINNHWNYFRASLLNYLEACQFGITGKITDACTGKPIRARVFVLNHDKDSSHVYSSPHFGNYHRPIAAGTYTLLFSAAGYQSQIINNIGVGNQSVVAQNVSLQPIIPEASFSYSKTDLCSPRVQFKDKSGSASQWLWDFGDGTVRTEKNPFHDFTGAGPYSIKLIATNCAGSDTVVLQNVISISASQNPLLQGDTSTCGAKIHLLSALNGGNVEWYSGLSGGSRLDSGATFQTEPLNQTTIFYAQSVKELPVKKVGPFANNIGGGGFFTANAYHYLLFDCVKACQLKSVKVFANTAGNRTIQLRNSQGTVLSTITVAIPQGESRVILNFSIPVGEAMQLGMAGGNSNNLYRNNSGAAYPYEIDGLISINGNSAGNPIIYYFFYDWEIGSRCESPRFPVTALVTNAPQPQISISSSNLSICQGDTARFFANYSNAGLSPEIFWLVNGVESGIGNSFASTLLSNNAQVQCRLKSADSCAVNNPALSNTLQVVVIPIPSAPVLTIQNGVIKSSDLSGNQWFFNGELLSGVQSDSIIPVQNGEYFVRKLGANGCLSPPSNSILFSGVEQLSNLPKIEIRTTGTGIQVLLGEVKNQPFQILDFLGRPVMAGQLTGTGEISLEKVPAGNYLFRSGGLSQAFGWNQRLAR